MRVFYKKSLPRESLSHEEITQKSFIRTKIGDRSKTSFSFIKGNPSKLHQIKGVSSNNKGVFNVDEQSNEINRATGRRYSKKQSYKMKPEEVLDLI